jgi:hypothetical protein
MFLFETFMAQKQFSVPVALKAAKETSVTSLFVSP